MKIQLGPNDSPLMPSASVAIGSNGYKILTMPKYASKIAKTKIVHCQNPAIVKMEWLDADGKLVAWYTGGYYPDRYPLIGEVEES